MYFTNNCVLFQVKVTSPHRYVVKPHKGEIEGNGEIACTITLLPFHYKPEFLAKDKFRLQVIHLCTFK